MPNLFTGIFDTSENKLEVSRPARDCGSQLNMFDEPAVHLDGAVAMTCRQTTAFVGHEAHHDREAWLSDVAYKAVSNWQYNRGHGTASTFGIGSSLATNGYEREANRVTDRQLQLIKAMIAAVRSDGPIDPTERQRILDAVTVMGVLTDAEELLDGLMDQTITIDELALDRSDIEWMAEIYLASLIAIDADHQSASAYLGQLESVLELPAGLAQKLQWHAQRALEKHA